MPPMPPPPLGAATVCDLFMIVCMWLHFHNLANIVNNNDCIMSLFSPDKLNILI